MFGPGEGQSPLAVSGQPLKVADGFTVEAFVLLRSMYQDASVRTIVSQWTGGKSSPGWALGVTSTRSAYKPRNLILQLVGSGADGKRLYEVVPSNIHLELNRPYYVAVSVRLSEKGPSGVTFQVRDLTDDAAPTVAQAKHQVVGDVVSATTVCVGGRDGQKGHQWHGLVDELRISTRALAPDALLGKQDDAAADNAPVWGHWQFEKEPGLYADSAGARKLQRSTSSDHSLDALVDLCHVLINSNQFLYVD